MAEGGERVDLLIVGAGPCGLAAAIAAGRAGLRAVVLDRGCLVSGVAAYPPYMTFFSTAERIAIGGVPFAVAAEKPSRRDALAYYRAVTRHFGLDVRQYEEVAGVEALGATDRDGTRFLVRSRPRGGAERTWRAHAVVVATGYFGTPSKLGVPGEDLPHVSHYFDEGHYAFEQDVVVVGGGNSAGQAAVHLARYARSVTMLVRGAGLAATMSKYLITEIASNPVISVRVRTEIVDGGGSGGLETLTVADRVTGRRATLPATALFVLIGAEPHTDWLAGMVARDTQGYLLTGQLAAAENLDPAWPVERPPMLLETSVPGVFAAGDVRSRSVKRVAAAVGEGATAVRLIHAYLAGEEA